MKKPILNLDIINKIKRNSYFERPTAPSAYHKAAVLKVIMDNEWIHRRAIERLVTFSGSTIANCIESLKESGLIHSKMIKGQYQFLEKYNIVDDEDSLASAKSIIDNAPKNPPRAKREKVTKKITTLLKVKSFTRRELSDDIGVTLSTIDGALHKLMNKGEIEKNGKTGGLTQYKLV